MRARKSIKRVGGHNKTNQTRKTTTQEQKPNQPDKRHKPNQTKRGEPGRQRRTGAEKAAYRIRVAIVQLSGDQWGTRIIILMNTSAR